MLAYTYPCAAIDPGQLSVELIATLGDLVIGVSTYGPDRPITVWLTDKATEADAKQAESVVQTHKPTPPAPLVTLEDLAARVATLEVKSS